MVKILGIISTGCRIILYKGRDQSLFYTGAKRYIATSVRLCCEAEMKRNWNKPDGDNELKIYNSLTKEKV